MNLSGKGQSAASSSLANTAGSSISAVPISIVFQLQAKDDLPEGEEGDQLDLTGGFIELCVQVHAILLHIPVPLGLPKQCSYYFQRLATVGRTSYWSRILFFDFVGKQFWVRRGPIAHFHGDRKRVTTSSQARRKSIDAVATRSLEGSSAKQVVPVNPSEPIPAGDDEPKVDFVLAWLLPGEADRPARFGVHHLLECNLKVRTRRAGQLASDCRLIAFQRLCVIHTGI